MMRFRHTSYGNGLLAETEDNALTEYVEQLDNDLFEDESVEMGYMSQRKKSRVSGKMVLAACDKNADRCLDFNEAKHCIDHFAKGQPAYKIA